MNAHTTTALGWIVTNNTPGYLPDADDPPHVFASRADAVESLISDMREWADEMSCESWDVAGCDESGCAGCDDVVATVGAILTDDGPDTVTGDWSVWVDYGRSLPRAWSLTSTTDAPTDDV